VGFHQLERALAIERPRPLSQRSRLSPRPLPATSNPWGRRSRAKLDGGHGEAVADGDAPDIDGVALAELPGFVHAVRDCGRVVALRGAGGKAAPAGQGWEAWRGERCQG
jgi:hypothetical protein